MKPTNDPLARLFRAAARGNAGATPEEPPFGFESRVLAGWRGTAVADMEPDWAVLVAWCHRALLGSIVLLALSIALRVGVTARTPEPVQDAITIADAAVRESLWP